MNQKMNEKIREIILSYSSIIDVEETNETIHLIADLTDLFDKEAK